MHVPSPTGILLFLFIPLVLTLYLAMPLGPGPSLAIGIAVMLGHGFLARPYLRRNLASRCFWCSAATSSDSPAVPFRSRGTTVGARACSSRCAERVIAFGRAVSAWRAVLFALVVVPVVLYLANGIAMTAGTRAVPLETARWGFKVPIAAAVVVLSFAWPAGRAMRREAAIDFPAHNLFLLGIGNTLWVFRIVGLWWLASAAAAAIRV